MNLIVYGLLMSFWLAGPDGLLTAHAGRFLSPFRRKKNKKYSGQNGLIRILILSKYLVRRKKWKQQNDYLYI